LGTLPPEKSVFAVSLVQKSVEEYSRTGRILPEVAEASIFRSPFYVHCFLPVLLSPNELGEAQRELIEELFKCVSVHQFFGCVVIFLFECRLGKVPQTMYLEYIAASAKDLEQSGSLLYCYPTG
jgi:hypothetical protein